MRLPFRASRLVALALAFALACGDDDAPRDGGLDGAVDGSIDASLDAPPFDGEVDGDGGRDAGPDASPPPPDCVEDDDCDDGEPCNGAESCDRGFCRRGPALVCFDGTSCRRDTCVPFEGCAALAGDRDDDGMDDCNDCAPDDASIHRSATEVCNGQDDDCDTLTDEWLRITSWADCDGDGFAPFGAIVADGCEPPPVSRTFCRTETAAWVTREPDFGSYDCSDEDARAFSGQTAFFDTLVVGAHFDIRYDYDCDEEFTLEHPGAGGCASVDGACRHTAGWASEIPECGVDASFVEGCTSSCEPRVVSRRQACR